MPGHEKLHWGWKSGCVQGPAWLSVTHTVLPSLSGSVGLWINNPTTKDPISFFLWWNLSPLSFSSYSPSLGTHHSPILLQDAHCHLPGDLRFSQRPERDVVFQELWLSALKTLWRKTKQRPGYLLRLREGEVQIPKHKCTLVLVILQHINISVNYLATMVIWNSMYLRTSNHSRCQCCLISQVFCGYGCGDSLWIPLTLSVTRSLLTWKTSCKQNSHKSSQVSICTALWIVLEAFS